MGIIEHLQPLVLKDSTTSEFLQSELGGSMNEGSVEAVSTGDKLNGSYIKGYSHHAFYLSNIMNGMGFGPQFRGVHPSGTAEQWTNTCPLSSLSFLRRRLGRWSWVTGQGTWMRT